ncbi:MAG: glycosyltransferase family 2 protein [Planctomycetia bacterium]|nr:glycosyltransferase family 2 protein [Planctomycetia bacterium]
MTAPELCVIVAVRNAATTLAAALESVLAQELPPGRGPLDVLVIDGGSTDGSVDLARRPGVRVVHQTGRGLAAARNEAIRSTTAPLIAFCDADDRWTVGSLATRLEALAAHPAVQAVIGQLVLESLDGVAPTPAQQDLIGRPRPGFTPGALLARRGVFTAVGPFDETLRIGSDSEWFVRLHASAAPLLVIDAVVLRKGARDTSLSTDVAAYRRELLTVARRFLTGRRGGTPE